MIPYNHKTIEAAAQSAWTAADAYRVTERADKKKFYACSMLPYPSGKLHMGHVRNYTINDVMARYLRMKGFNVLMPMGWDAFGLPAENAAMKNKVAPAKWTYDNIAYMKKQMQAMGLAIDWSREVTACKPDYYKWNQWLFLKMLEKGIAERRTQVVNWDPVDMTVLANEQVIDGKGWRTGATVEKREIPGYYLNIVKYAPELLDHTLTKLPGWPERVRTMQENWIGKSEGVRFAFPHSVKDASGALVQEGKMYVFTTRADTIMGVTFVAVAAEHPLASVAAVGNAKIAAFIEECKRGGVAEADMATMEKKGVATGLFVTHPLTGAQVEVWIGNYVLMSYGDGAVMGVPAHDERDFAFAKKYGLEIKQVIARREHCMIDKSKKQDSGILHPVLNDFDPNKWEAWYGEKTGFCINSSGIKFDRYDESLDQSNYETAVDKVSECLRAQGLGEKKITYRLRDWGISRQRYWGTPIPMILCNTCGAVPVPEKDLPVILPEDCIPDGSGNPLKLHAGFLNVACPKCAQPAQRETDTMDTFIDSSWYFMRYCDPHLSTGMVGKGAEYWMPMDQYIGGIEHAILHLLYARFWTKVMRDLGLVKFDEPFTKLLTQGMVLAETFYRKNADGSMDWFNPSDVDVETDAHGKPVRAVLRSDSQPVFAGGVEKMAKSKNNGLDPQDLIDAYGADTARHFTMRAAHPEDTLFWSESGVAGSYRFMRRLWDFAQKVSETIKTAPQVQSQQLSWKDASDAVQTTRREIHATLQKASFDIERIQYNTVVSAGDILLNALGELKSNDAHTQALIAEGMSILLRVLYPVTPHLTHQLWEQLGYAAKHGDILDAPWPEVDASALKQDNVTLVLQINGKTRGELVVPAAADKAAIEAAAASAPEVARYAEGRPPKKIIVVPGRLVNVVA
jgi:leucyl-tRNA synthetase